MRNAMPQRRRSRFKQVVINHLLQVKASLFPAALCMLGFTLTGLLAPWPLKIIFDYVLLDHRLPPSLSLLGGVLQHGKVPALALISLAVVLIALLKGLFSYAQLHITSRIGYQMVYSLRRQLFVHLQRLSLSFHNRARSGDLLIKVTDDTNTLKDVFVESALAVVGYLLTFFGMFAVMFALNWNLSLIVLATLPVLNGRMTPGAILIFASYTTNLYKPIRGLGRLSARASKAMVGAERIAEILEIEPEIQDGAQAVKASGLKGEIIFENVSFHYGDGKSVLNNVSFTISSGQTAALVGPSGVGKSTIANLLLRFYDPQQGRILIDVTDIRQYRLASLKGQIARVLQESVLFCTTIKEKIAYGKLDATMEEIIAATKAANAHDFILELEHGYDTIIGERGDTLSGGQRQRIAIARALIRNASILILDEPMRGLDVESEMAVREALKRLMAGKTSLLITHDLQAVAEADLVLVLQEGRIVERGGHSDLMARSGQYRQLYELKIGR